MKDTYTKSILLSLAVLAALNAAVWAEETTKTNTQPASPVQKVMSARLMAGYPDGQFHSEGLVSRAELASILVKAFDIEGRIPPSPNDEAIRDVSASHWAYPAIRTVLRNGVMTGYRDGYFYPNQKVTRAEAFAIIAQAYGVFQFKPEDVDAILAQYADASQIPDWARKAMATALHEGFVNTVETDKSASLVRPSAPMKRGDLAFALSQYLDRQKKPSVAP